MSTTIDHAVIRRSRLAALRRNMGDWAFTRYLKNQGVSLETALFIMTGR